MPAPAEAAAALGAPGRAAAPVRRTGQRAPLVVPQRSARFSVLVLADADSPVAAQADAALRAVGAADVRYASSPADLMRRIRIPPELGVGVICRSPHEVSVVQLVAQLRQRGWRRLILACAAADEPAIRTAIAAKVRCLIRRTDAARPTGAAPETDTAATAAMKDLSAREVQVLQAVADGHTNNEIGDLLGLSGLTVKSHLARIGRKVGTGDRAQMVARAMRAGLLH